MAVIKLGKVRMTDEGVYSISKYYDVLSLVKYNKSTYLSKVPVSPGIVPGEDQGAYWYEFAKSYETSPTPVGGYIQLGTDGPLAQWGDITIEKNNSSYVSFSVPFQSNCIYIVINDLSKPNATPELKPLEDSLSKEGFMFSYFGEDNDPDFKDFTYFAFGL